MAAVNDITSRDESLQNYLAQTNIKNDMLTNGISHVQNNIYDPNDNDEIHQLRDIDSVQLTQMETQQQNTSAMPHQYPNNLKVNNGENEFVDINEMDFMDHRPQIDHENLLVRRSQRKIKKDEECKFISYVCTLIRFTNFVLVSVVIADKHVPCRSLCSLPTSYLYINRSNSTGEFN